MAQNLIAAFQPRGGVSSTTTIAVTGSSQQLTLPSIGPDGSCLLLTNSGTQVVFVSYGSVTASITTSLPILANTQLMISLPPGITQISCIAATVGSTLYASVGDGCLK
ncbi:hypothetical protein UFOVP671_14 [uncultured Caudovirales phage]|uniref:Uncharacterized protein n=1 Tax=uncultured Caudovirales phage TaxID=2100421 RepID=A0A6J5N7G2_9CAUD|nr:hypothetical protein UFOVP671_14 [uncultured Caudovirales phage]